MKTYLLFFFFTFIGTFVSAQSIYSIAAKKNDTVKVYIPTFIFEKDTILPTINVFSKKENTESFTVLIISGDTLSDPRRKMHIGNAHGSMYAHFGSGPVYGKSCNIFAWVNMEIFKKMSNPKRSFKIFYYKDPADEKGDTFEDKFKPNLTSITINVLNE